MNTPENKKSVNDANELLNDSVALTAAGASGDAAGILDDEPMCMHTVVCVSSHAAKNGSHVAAVDAGQAEVRRDLAEAHRVATASGVAPHLGGGELGIPQRDDLHRQQPATAVAAPLFDHPVVVRVDALERELVVLRFVEGLTAEARERREGQRLVDVVEGHVLEAELGVLTSLAHLVVGDRRERHVVTGESDRGHVALVGIQRRLRRPRCRRGRRCRPRDRCRTRS